MAAFTRGGFCRNHHIGDASRVPSSGVAAFIGLAAEAKLVQLECTRASALHTLSFSFDPGDATGTQGIGVCSTKVC